MDNVSQFSNLLILEPGTDSMFNEYTALHNVVNSYDNPDHIEIGPDYFQTSYSYPGIILSRDIILGRSSNGELVASGTIFIHSTNPPSARIMIQVHPDYRHQGFGSKILEHLIRRARARRFSEIVCRIPTFRPDAIHFAEKHGFRHSHTLIKMQLEYEFPKRTIIVPTELKIRELDLDHELDLWASLQNSIFRESENYKEITIDSLASLTKHVGFDSDLLIVGEVDNIAIGYCLGMALNSVNGQKSEKILQIQGIGVLHEYRGRGYAQALLNGVLTRGWTKGYTKSELLVLGSNTGAFQLYQKNGFTDRFGYLWYRREC
ncbi:MAG: GNAT family N-acetyltransferase [Candidatus Thorarchaeota archaeon]|nr:GNAT family N-acetyltransferase [Candidatus Thorarchaeota archaeon]